jgi:uncharacterized protein YndB with AHSA1/START domain
MAWWKRIVLAIVVLAVAAVGVAFVLPRFPVVTRSIEIAAPPAAIYPLVSDLRRFNEWSPWAALDPATVYTFTGTTEGVGQTMNWESKDPQVGLGTMTITKLTPDSEVDSALAFGPQQAGSWVRIEPKGDRSSVTWGFRSDVGFNPIMRYFALGLDRLIGLDYERGLEKLKAAAETEKTAI